MPQEKAAFVYNLNHTHSVWFSYTKKAHQWCARGENNAYIVFIFIINNKCDLSVTELWTIIDIFYQEQHSI